MAIYYGNTSLNASGIGNIYVGNDLVFASTATIDLYLNITNSDTYKLSITKFDTKVLNVYLNDTLYQTITESGDIQIPLSTISGVNHIQLIGASKWNFNSYILGSASANTALTGVTFSSTAKLSTLTENTFNNCINLTEITLPNSIKHIESHAFYNCTNLTTIYISKKIESIAKNAFDGCTNLRYTSYLATNYLGSIDNPYLVLTGTTTTLLEASIHTDTRLILAEAFAECKSLTEVIIPKSVLYMGSSIFNNCTSLFNICCGASQKPIGWDDNWIGECGAEIIWGYKVPSVGLTFSSNEDTTCTITGIGGCTDTEIVIPKWSPAGELVTTISSNAFAENNQITSVIFPDSIEKLDGGSFKGCSMLKTVELPDTLTFIGQAVFNNCNRLESCVIPANVETFNAFSNCISLKSIVFLGSPKNAYYLSSFGCCNNLKYFKGPLAIAKGVLSSLTYANNITVELTDTVAKSSWDYTLADLSCIAKLVLAEGITTIPKNLCTNCTNLTEVVIPNTITTIESCAFQDCTNLTAIQMPNSVTSIGDSAFKNCTNLMTASLSSNITTIDSYAFEGCTALKELNLPIMLSSVGSYAFYNCNSLNKFTFPTQLERVGLGAFSSCSGVKVEQIDGCNYITDNNNSYYILTVGDDAITSHIVKENTKIIADRAFYASYPYSRKISAITFPNTLVAIGKEAFSHSNITSLSFPSTLRLIDSSAFESCSGLTSVTISEGLTTINNYAFDGCKILSSINFPTTLQSIGDRAFYGCKKLTNIQLFENVTSIGISAFEQCTTLANVQLNIACTTLDSTFCYCTQLNNVVIPEGVSSLINTFNGCRSLNTISLPATLTSISATTFTNCNFMTSYYDNAVYSGDTTNPFLILTSALNTEITSCDIIGSCKVIATEAFKDCPNLTNIVIPENICGIGSKAFSNSGLVTFIVNNPNVSLGYSCLDGCKALTTFKGPYTGLPSISTIESSNLETIIITKAATGSRIYQNYFWVKYYPKLTSLTLCEGFSKIEQEAFRGSKITSLILPESLETIAYRAFYLSDLANITIPNADIEDYAFEYCDSLTTVCLGNGVTSIGIAAFKSCYKLASISIGTGLTTINKEAFYSCNINNIVLPNSLQIIGDNAFYANSFAELVIPSAVKSIGTTICNSCGKLTSVIFDSAITGQNTFINCRSLKNVTFRGNISYIGTSCFNGCTNLNNITLSNSILRIGKQAFYNCTALGTVFLPKYLRAIGVDAFTGCPNIDLRSETGNPYYLMRNKCLIDLRVGKLIQAFNGCSIPTDVQLISIGQSAFAGTDITSAILPVGLQSIGNYAFRQCLNLTTVVIPDTVTWIGTQAFYFSNAESTAITNISISKNLVYIGDYAFAYCSKAVGNLELSQNLAYLGVYAFAYCKNLTGDIVIPGTITQVKSYVFNSSGITSVEFKNGVSQVDGYAFSSCENLTNIILPATLTNNITSIFSDVCNLNTITVDPANPVYYAENNCLVERSSKTIIKGTNISVIPTDGSILSIATTAFRYLSNLSSLIIPDSVTTLGDDAFVGCKNLSSVVLGSGLSTLPDSAFYRCTKLASIIIPNNITTIGNSTFRNTGLVTIQLPNSIETIGKECFAYCASLTDIIFSDTLTEIPEKAFFNCTNLSKVILGENILTIGKEAFDYCINIDRIIFNSKLTTINYEAFRGCHRLLKVVFPDTLTTIGEGAFSSCTSLNYVNFGNGRLAIERQAFSYCEQLKLIVVGPNITTIGTSAFEGNWHIFVVENKSSLPIVKGEATYGGIARWAKEVVSDLTYSNLKIVNDCYFYPNENTGNLGLVGYAGDSTIMTIPNDIGLIADTGFHQNKYLTGVVFNNTITEVDDSMFYGCRNLETLNLGTTLLKLGRSTFEGCNKLTNIAIPMSITEIDYTTFSNCSNLATLTVDPANPKYHSENNCIIETATKTLFLGCKNSIIPSDESVTTIGEYAFSSCNGLTNITIPTNIIRIKHSAFKNCDNLSNITFTEGLAFIDGYAFGDCTTLTNIMLPSTLVNFGSSVFGNCPNINYNIYENNKYLGNLDNPHLVLVELADKSISSAIINENTKIIGGNAFYSCQNLVSLIIPNSIQTLGEYCFAHCDNLVDITLSSNLKYIADGAFYSCTNLAGIIIPDTVISIEEDTFSYCTNLSSISASTTIAPVIAKSSEVGNCTVILTSGTQIDDKAFYRCENLTGIEFATNLLAIGDYAFYRCTGLTNITIPNGVTTIGKYALSECSGLTSIMIPDSIITIGDCAFYGCTSLNYNEYNNGCYLGNESNLYTVFAKPLTTSITTCVLNDTTKLILARAFNECYNLTNLTLNNTLISIGTYAFGYCSSLENITLPESLTTIETNAFYFCRSLASITLPDNLITINDYAFRYCYSYNFTTLEIPASVNHIGVGILIGCDNITSLTVSAENPTYYSKNNCIIETATKKLILGCNESVIPLDENITYIGKSAFESCYNFTTLDLPKGITTIEDRAFCGTGIASFELPDSLITIGKEAFAQCNALTTALLKSNITTIKEGAFSSCSQLVTINLPNSLESIEKGTFKSCSSLTTISLPNSIKIIKNDAFRDSGIINITIPDSVLEICEDVFYLCDHLEAINLGKGITKLNMPIAGWAPNLATLTVDPANPKYHSENNCIIETATKTLVMGCKNSIIPSNKSVTAIGANAFNGCNTLTNITIPDAIISIGEQAFYYCQALTGIEFNSVKTIGDAAFFNCISLTTSSLGEQLLSISPQAFSSTKLQEIIIPACTLSIGYGVFNYCNELAIISINKPVDSISGAPWGAPNATVIWNG